MPLSSNLPAPIAVIADDLTGAAEIAGIAIDYGLSPIIARGPASGAADLLILDTDSRSLAPADAAERLEDALWSWLPPGTQVIFKKVDSVLRGPIAAELEILMGHYKMRRMILVAQNPSKGRVILPTGDYRIRPVEGDTLGLTPDAAGDEGGIPLDETTFRNDPEYPRTTSSARALVAQSAQKLVTHATLRHMNLDEGIVIGCGETTRDLAAWAKRPEAQPLVAGAADMFRTVLEVRGLERQGHPPIDLHAQKTLVVCGSTADSSRDTIAAWQAAGIPLCPAADALFSDPANRTHMFNWSARAIELLGQHDKLILTIPQRIAPERARALRVATALVVQRVLTEVQHLYKDPSLNLLMEGGATAAAIIDRMQWKQFDVLGNLAPGVVALRPAETPNTRLIMKPGSYPWGVQITNMAW